MLEQGRYGKSANQIRNFGIRIGSKGWVGRAGVRSGAGLEPRLGEQSSRRPPLSAAGGAARGPPRGAPRSVRRLAASPGRGGSSRGGVRRRAEGGPAEGTGYGGRRRRLWTRAGPFSRISPATAPVGAPFARGPPAGRLGWRLAAGLELVRTRGIRLFN